MDPSLILPLTVAALLMIGGVMLVMFLGFGVLLVASKRRGGPRMPRWQVKVMRDKVDRHLREKAEAEVVATVLEAAGYEPQE